MSFDGTPGTRLDVPASSLFAFGTGDFIVEAWLYIPNTIHYGLPWSIGTYGADFGFYGGIDVTAGTTEIIFAKLDPYATLVYSTIKTNAEVTDSFHHIVWQRASGNCSIYLDGVLQGSAVEALDVSGPTRVRIGNLNHYNGPDNFVDANYAFLGNIEEFRVTKGVARYNSNFSVPTTPYSNK